MRSADANSGTTPADEVDAAARWRQRIGTSLAARKNGATASEVARLAKTLSRLEGAALAAMEHHGPGAPALHDAFEESLMALSRG